MEATATLLERLPEPMEAPEAATGGIGDCQITDELLRRLREAGL
jgi:hypothetical protein